MTRQTIKRLMAKGIMAYVAVFSLLLMVAMPAIALVAANQVNSRSIINGHVKTKDLRRRAVTGKKLAINAVKSGHVKNGSLKGADISDGSITGADIGSVSDSKINYSTKTGYLSIPVSALSPGVDGLDYGTSDGTLYMATSNGWFNAPALLPQGAVITNLRYNAFDFSDSFYTSIELKRISNSNGDNVDDMASLTTSGTAKSVLWQPLSTTAITNATVDNNNYAYSIRVWLDGPDKNTLNAGNTVIEYSYTSPGS